MVSYDLTKAVGMNKEWNEIWTEILNSKLLSEFSVANIISQFDKEWKDWIKNHPEIKGTEKRNLLWEKAIVNTIGGRAFKTDFQWIFSNSMTPYIAKSKNNKLIVDGVLIEKLLDDIRKDKGIISYIADTPEGRSEYLTYMEFLIRGMEKGIYTP